MQPKMIFAVGVSLVALSGCTALPQVCSGSAEPMVTAEMLFGRKVGDRLGVSEAAFANFVAAEVTPRFPDGLTVIDARGQWREASGAVVREPSKVVLLTFRDDAGKRAGLDAIADAYKRRFHQQSVLTTMRSVCATF